MLADPKPSARAVASKADWERIALAKAGRCRACDGPAQEYHHLVPRSQRGDDTEANIVPLCRDCHRVYTDHAKGWEPIAAHIRHSLTDAEVAYVTEQKGRHFLDNYLPAGDYVLCSRCKRAVKGSEPSQEPLSAPRRRKRYVITVPDDLDEDGAAVLDGLVDLHRVRLAPELGWSEDVGAYFVVATVLAKAAL